MKWFQHDTNTESDLKIKRLKKEYGIVGKAIYFEINRLIAKDIEADKPIDQWGFLNEDFIKFPEFLLEEFGDISNDKNQEESARLRIINDIITYCIEITLLYYVDGKIVNPRVLKRGDNYIAKIAGRKGTNLEELYNNLKTKCEQSSNSVRTIFDTLTNKVLTDKIRGDKIRGEEIREEEIRFLGNEKNTSSVASPENLKKQENHDVEDPSRANAREPSKEFIAPPPAGNTQVMGVDMSHVFQKKKGGITKKWQDKAFRHAEYLGIFLKDESLKKRWLRFYKDHYCNKVESVVSYLVDYAPFKALAGDEARIKYFFSVFTNKSV